MKVSVTIQDGPLPIAEARCVQGAGAVLCFEGVVRPSEADQAISGLRYETYDPMAVRELVRLAELAVEKFDLLRVQVEHSRGFVPNHACSFRLKVASTHRKEALAAMDWFIDRMKQVVPIWKRPELSGRLEEAAR